MGIGGRCDYRNGVAGRVCCNYILMVGWCDGSNLDADNCARLKQLFVCPVTKPVEGKTDARFLSESSVLI